jgi:hypothetical protein
MENDNVGIETPLFMDFAVEVPDGVQIEQNAGGDCVTWDGDSSGCDDD